MQNFSERLLLSLRESALTKGELAKKTGVALSTVSRWFNGTSHPRGDTLLQLASLLGANAHWLLTGEGKQKTPSQEAIETVRQTLADDPPDTSPTSPGAAQWREAFLEMAKRTDTDISDGMKILLELQPPGYREALVGLAALLRKNENQKTD